MWTPHDVAEWLYMQNTKEEYSHTFLVHNIDGPALLGLTREQMAQWNVKPIDVSTILKGVESLRRIAEGNIGWAPNAEDATLAKILPTAPPGPKPTRGGKPPPARKNTTAAGAGGEQHRPSAQATPYAADDDGGDGGAGAPYAAAAGAPSAAGDGDGGEWALTSVPTMGASAAATRKAATSGLARNESQRIPSVSAASPAYLRKIMGELHASERVPLWKEEMMERVKRAATARHQQESLSATAPAASRLARTARERRGAHDDGDRMSAVSSRRGGGGGGGGAPSVADSIADAAALAGSGGVGGAGSTQAREIERKLYWYQDAIHEQELQQQLLDQKFRALSDEVEQLLDRRRQETNGLGLAHLEKEIGKKQQRERNRLSRALQVSEERVADAERLNRATAQTINKLRRGRADFLHQIKKLDDRVAMMAADMKHFATSAHASLDEKEKVEARLKRQQFDYRNELSHTEHVFDLLHSELQTLEERIVSGHQAEEEFLQSQRQSQYRHVKEKRDEERKRELRLGYLQNLVRGQEMDFQRLHRIMGVKCVPPPHPHPPRRRPATDTSLARAPPQTPPSRAPSRGARATVAAVLAGAPYRAPHPQHSAFRRCAPLAVVAPLAVADAVCMSCRVRRRRAVLPCVPCRRFTPERPDSVMEIVKASLSHEQRNASLLQYVGVQNAQIEEFEDAVRKLEQQEVHLETFNAEAARDDISSAEQMARLERMLSATSEGIGKRESDLVKLCPIVESLTNLSGASEAVSLEGALSLKGYRPDTLSDFLRHIDVALKELRQRAESLPTASGNEWLRDFLRPHEVVSGVTVVEIRRELEAAAQKQKEAKEAKQMAGDGDGGVDPSGA